MTSPHDVGAASLERHDQTGGLRIVEHDDVARSYLVEQRVGLSADDLFVDCTLAVAERAVVALVVMEVVVHPFR